MSDMINSGKNKEPPDHTKLRYGSTHKMADRADMPKNKF